MFCLAPEFMFSNASKISIHKSSQQNASNESLVRLTQAIKEQQQEQYSEKLESDFKIEAFSLAVYDKVSLENEKNEPREREFEGGLDKLLRQVSLRTWTTKQPVRDNRNDLPEIAPFNQHSLERPQEAKTNQAIYEASYALLNSETLILENKENMHNNAHSAAEARQKMSYCRLLFGCCYRQHKAQVKVANQQS